MARILWVEDQGHWIDKFKDVLEAFDFDGQANSLAIFRYPEAACQQIALMPQEAGPQIAVLDARMNGNDQAGFTVTRALRKKWPTIPILFLSEHNGTDVEKDALEGYGVADFISKHQKNIEQVLCWRIKAVLRQSALGAARVDALPGGVIVRGALRLDLDTWEAYWHGKRLMNPDNPKRPLAPTPRKILRCLVERSPRPVTTGQVAEYLGVDPDTYANATYRQHIKILRQAIAQADGSDGKFLEQCKAGLGIAACDDGAYCWRDIADSGEIAE